MTPDPTLYARENIRTLQPYASARDSVAADANLTLLDANENPFGDGMVNRYPDPVQGELRDAYARIKGVNPEMVVFGNGSDELIDLSIRIFCEPGKDAIVVCPPTFGMYKVSATANNVDVRSVPLMEPDFSLDTAGVMAASKGAKMLFLCSPNSPTGNILNREDMLLLIRTFDGIVAIDEAYIEFTQEESCTSLIAQYPKVIVFQTFSKYWGLAGARVGAVLADSRVADLFRRTKAPYNVNNLSARAALQALGAAEQKEQEKEILLAEREKLAEVLSGLSFVSYVFPSVTNFLYMRTAPGAGERVYSFLFARGIVIRNYGGAVDHLRISVGTPDQNRALTAALNDFSSTLS